MQPPLLLIPGALCGAELFKHQMEQLSSDYDISMACINDSDTISGMAQSVLAKAADKFALCGLSLGGIVALEIFSQAPERVDRLALLDTNPKPLSPDAIKDRQQEMGIVAREGEVALLELIANNYYQRYVSQRYTADPQLKSIVVGMAQAAGVQTLINQWQAIIAKPNYTDILTKITCPTLVLCGAEDSLCVPDIHRDMAAAIPNATLEIVADCGHLSTLEAADVVTASIHKWLQI